MSPHASITTPPAALLPRQTYNPKDPYGVSSFYAELSSLYPELYSSYSYNPNDYTSLMDYYSSLLKSYSITDYSFPTMTASATRADRTTTSGRATATGSRATPTAAAASSVEGKGGDGGLSTGAKIGIGVGVTLAVLLFAGLGICIWCMGKRKGKKFSTTVIAAAQPVFSAQQQAQPQKPFQQQPPQMGYANNQGYMPGYSQQQQQQVSLFTPQYAQLGPSIVGAYGVGAGYAKAPDSNVAELEHEYHFAKPGVVEMGDGIAEPPLKQQGKELGKKLGKKK